MTDFGEMFKKLTGYEPLRWQNELAAASICRDRLIRIPTGLGKTAGVLAAWAFHRLHRSDNQWPRRLVWCLPMRVLVEQTYDIAHRLAELITEEHRPAVHIVMGGEETDEWFLYPERPAIIVGTQDMLLSRALNRGYASARARWPMEFGLLNHDALWVMDEVQLMDVGLATSAQLQAYREQDCGKGFRPCHTWWMSATLQPKWLCSVDTKEFHEAWVKNPCTVPPAQRDGGLWKNTKAATTATFKLDDHQGYAKRILEEHGKLTDGAFGKITLVVCNTVDRACHTFDALQKAGRTDGLELVHSRYRPAERERWRRKFLAKEFCKIGVDRIIVATQVVEAGVDISAGCLITELAPWPSLVQRFGRCARYGGSGSVLVVDRGRDQKQTAPYQPEEMEIAWETIQKLNNVGIAALESYEESLSSETREQLYPYSPAHLLLRKEFDELFDTTADLTGADLDISRFIRSGDERDLQVFWIDIEKDEKGRPRKKPPEDYQPYRRELCAVPFLKARDWLCGEGTKTRRNSRLRNGIRAWIWDWIDGEWKVATRETLIPGRVVCVSADSGGYTTDRGFNPDSTELVTTVSSPTIPEEIKALNNADSQQNKEISGNCWKTIACHTSEVADAVGNIATKLCLSEKFQNVLKLATQWHDWGKAHPAFQGSMRGNGKSRRPDRLDLAKAPKECWPKKYRYHYLDDSETRPAFRHELASALGLFMILRDYAPQHLALLGPWIEVLEKLGKTPISQAALPAPPPLVQQVINCSAEAFNLVAYLIVSHHGKVRVALHAAPQDQDYDDKDGCGLPIRGIREGDRLPSVVLALNEPPVPEVTLTLAPAALGLSEKTGGSWRERSLSLIGRYGPGGLAFLEAVLRAADVRASRLPTNDPLIASEARA
jgi:CRISPR-associated endonuclease/helicase Cas3